MRVSNNGTPLGPVPVATTPVGGVSGAGSIDAGSLSTATAGAAAESAALQSSVLKPALAAMASMPEIDQARVTELRDAIARGELPFDAAKLAGLIQRYHGGRG